MIEFRTGFGFQDWEGLAQVCSRHGIENWGPVVYRVSQLQSGEGLGWVDGFSGVMNRGQAATEAVMETEAGRPCRVGSLGRGAAKGSQPLRSPVV